MFQSTIVRGRKLNLYTFVRVEMVIKCLLCIDLVVLEGFLTISVNWRRTKLFKALLNKFSPNNSPALLQWFYWVLTVYARLGFSVIYSRWIYPQSSISSITSSGWRPRHKHKKKTQGNSKLVPHFAAGYSNEKWVLLIMASFLLHSSTCMHKKWMSIMEVHRHAL